MSQNVTPKRFSKQERKDKLIQGMLLGRPLTELAIELGVNRRTLYRDFQKWRGDEEFLDYVFAEWLSLVKQMKAEKPEKLFENLTKIILHTFKQKVEVSGEASIIIKAWDLGNAPDKPEKPNS